MSATPDTAAMLALATAGLTATYFPFWNRVNTILHSTDPPASAYRHLGLVMGLSTLFVGMVIGTVLFSVLLPYLIG